jgi:hypothetical protein
VRLAEIFLGILPSKAFGIITTYSNLKILANELPFYQCQYAFDEKH